MIWFAYDVADSSTSGNDAAPVDGAEMAMLITSSPLLAHWFIPGV